MPFTNIDAITEKLIAPLTHELPSIEDYNLLDEESFFQMVFEMSQLNPLMQQVLVHCIEAAEELIANKKTSGENSRILERIASKWTHGELPGRQIASLLKKIFLMRAQIKKIHPGLPIKHFLRGSEAHQ